MKKLFTFMAVVFTALTLNAEPILVAQAIEACNALDANVTSENEVTVEGFVVNAQDFSWGTNQQIWFMADNKDNTANQEIQAYYCTAEEDGNSVPVLNGDKVQLTGKLTKYVDKENKILLEIKNGKAAFVSKVDGDRSKPEAETITVAKALELGAGVDQGATSKVAYTIVGYVTAYEGKNADTDGGWEQYGNQIFWIADSKDSKAKSNADGAFEVYQGVADEKVNIGDKVSVNTKIKNYKGTLESETKAPVTILEKGEGGDEEKEDGDVVFDKDDFAGQGTATTGSEVKATKNGVTFWCDKAYGDGNYGVRCYKSGTIKITSTTEQIGKIVFEFAVVSGKKMNGDLDDEYIVNGKEWKAENITTQSRMNKIKIYFGEAEDETPELPDGVLSCAGAVKAAESIEDPVEVKSTVEGGAVKVRGYVTFAYDAKEGKQSAWIADKKGANAGVIQGAYLQVSEAVTVGDYVEIEGTLAKYLKEGKEGKANEIIIEVINGTMRKSQEGKYLITTFVTPENSGQVTIKGNTLTATPNYGYDFAQWNDGNTDNPRTVELTKDTTFTAEFAIATSGTCGKDNLLTWTYDVQTKRLTISGNGSFDENMTCGLEAKEKMEELVFEEGVTSIGSKAFVSCANLASVTIPSSVTSIREYAFTGCSNLTLVKLNSNAIVSKDYDYTSYHYENYELHLLLNFKTFFGKQVKEYILGDDVTSIGKNAFFECKSLTSITIPNSVISIGVGAFGSCTGLTAINVDSKNPNYCDIDGVLFNKNQSMLIQYPAGKDATEYTISGSVTSIGDDAFYGSANLTSISIPGNVTGIGEYAFLFCTGLTAVKIPNSVTDLREGVFMGCSGLTSIEIPNTISSIGRDAFSDCTGLTSVTIGESVTSVGESAFSYCTGLTSVTIPSNITNIGRGAFYDCTGLDSITWNAINCSDFSSSGTPFSYGPNDESDVLEKITSFAFGNEVEHIPAFLCSGMTKLEEINIPNSVTSIGQRAFWKCSYIRELTIGNSLQSIGESGFASCIRIADITCYAKSVPDIQANTFDEVNRKAYVWVAADKVHKYEIDPYWGEFLIKTKEAEQATTSTVQVTSHETTADVVWPSVENAASYELVIKDKNGNAVCTLIFNANGQLTEIAFSAPSRDNAPQQPQATGFAFTITGLDSGTAYDLTLVSKDENGDTLDEQIVSFTTQGDAPQSLDQIYNDQLQTNKVIHNGQLLILRGENVYTVDGQQVK